MAATVTQMTGLSRSEVTVKDVCAAPGPGRARCAAQALVLRADHSLVRPHVRATRRPQPSVHRALASAGASAGAVAAVSPPEPGSPAYLQQAYDLTYLSQTGGGGATVAIVDAFDDPTAYSDLMTYRSQWGLPPCPSTNGCFRKVNQYGQPSPLPIPNREWAMEISLDLDAVSALCPNCKILLVEARTNQTSDLQAAVAKAVELGATHISNSWGSTDPPDGPFTFPGVATVASTGDDGYLDEGKDNYPAAFAGVTAAGGTSLASATDPGNARGFSESAWSIDSASGAAGSGCDAQIAQPIYQRGLSGCSGRAYADLSADADPNTGLAVYDSWENGWVLAGGTSLSSPLIAAYYAATGVEASSPQWAYTNSALLNDPASGSTGPCDASIFSICNAGPGYDGPTGVGSISGAVVPGAPGIGGPSIGPGTGNTYTLSVDTASATLRGGVYPNSLDTTYWWEYGTSTAYGNQTDPVDIGSGLTPASASGQLTGLSAGTTYHYRLVAHNDKGTSYGYDFTLTTAGQSGSGGATTSPPRVTPLPRNGSAPTIGGTPRRGLRLTASTGTWNPSGTTYSVVWQRGVPGGYATISGADGLTYTPVRTDVDARLRVIVIARNAYGSAVATSQTVGPIVASPPVRGSAPVITGAPRQGRSLTFRQPVWRAATPDTRFAVQWKRCRRNGTGCVAIRGARGNSYRLTAADAGHRVTVSVTARNPDAAVSATSRPSAVVSAARVLHRRRAHR